MAAVSFSPAGFWKRYVAYFIDVVLVYLVIEGLAQVFFSGAVSAALAHVRQQLAAIQAQLAVSPDLPSVYQAQINMAMQACGTLTWLSLYYSLAYVVAGSAYFALCESSRWQATLGKRLLGIQVTDASGGRIGLGRALGRFFAAGLSWMTMNIGHAMAAFGSERRALHDYVAGTRVENADPAHPRMPAWGWWIVGAHAVLLLFAIGGLAMAMLLVFRTLAQT
jgi:uncharacterized RDD family membrane protein YckC